VPGSLSLRTTNRSAGRDACFAKKGAVSGVSHRWSLTAASDELH
jgi:hypothetical protein